MTATLTRRARPTTYCGVPMRSRLEADLAALIDRAGWAWEYEPRRFADGADTYLPDFYVVGPTHAEYIEAKPAEILTDREALNAALCKMTVIWASENDACLRLDAMRWNTAENCYVHAGLVYALPDDPPMTWHVRLPEFHEGFTYVAN